jgi:hypothetical protein
MGIEQLNITLEFFVNVTLSPASFHQSFISEDDDVTLAESAYFHLNLSHSHISTCIQALLNDTAFDGSAGMPCFCCCCALHCFVFVLLLLLFFPAFRTCESLSHALFIFVAY